MLGACHDRLRYFSELATLLASRLDASAEDVSDAARRLRTYFTVALPLHEADEELSLAPRLLASSNGASVAEALGLMNEQHGLLHVVLEVHLALEETTIFPWLEALPLPERDGMLDEIRARRTESVMTQMATIHV